MPANATLSFWHWDCTADSIDVRLAGCLHHRYQRQHPPNHFPSVLATANLGLTRQWTLARGWARLSGSSSWCIRMALAPSPACLWTMCS